MSQAFQQCGLEFILRPVKLPLLTLVLLHCVQESRHAMVVTGLRFSPGMPGPREVSFSWGGFTELVRVNLAAGQPAQFRLVDGPKEVSMETP